MQQQLFETKIKTPIIDRENPKEYCIEIISKKELYLWDMRCWYKPKNQYTIPEVIRQIEHWLDEDNDNWSDNCGHCVYCMKQLLDNGWATIEKVAQLVMLNNNIQYPNNIGEWNK